MIYTTKQRVAVVSEATAKEFEKVLNERLESLAKFRPEITYNMSQGHCAYINYEETLKIPEDIRDEYHLKGIHYTCKDCPLFEKKDSNKRRVWGFCPDEDMTRSDSEACLKFYRLLDKGDIKPSEQDE